MERISWVEYMSNEEIGLLKMVDEKRSLTGIGAVHKVRHARGGRGSEKVRQFVIEGAKSM